MNKSKGFGYCGKACCLCTIGNCQGCRITGDQDHSTCEVFQCAEAREVTGCFECVDFPCEKGCMQENVPQGFSKLLQLFTKEEVMDFLEANEKNGILYHYLETFNGDYHNAKTPEEVMKLALKSSDVNLLE